MSYSKAKLIVSVTNQVHDGAAYEEYFLCKKSGQGRHLIKSRKSKLAYKQKIIIRSASELSLL